MSISDLSDIARLIEALRPWLGRLVIVGGWAHRLHRFHPLAAPPSYLPLRTRDADLAFSLKAPPEGDIGAALEAAGFREDLSGENTPPVTHYRLGDDQGFYAEFLVPLTGSRLRRDGTRDATVTKAGVTAQKLRYLDLLLIEPWPVRLGAGAEIPLTAHAEVTLPNPVTFIAQKVLIHGHRTPDKQAQDVLYVHDTLELFREHLETLKGIWRNSIRPTLPARTARDLDRMRREQFGTVSDVIRTAIRIPQDRSIEPRRMQATCAYGLEEIFGPE